MRRRWVLGAALVISAAVHVVALVLLPRPVEREERRPIEVVVVERADRGTKTEDRRPTAENRGPRTENRRPRTENRKLIAENRGPGIEPPPIDLFAPGAIDSVLLGKGRAAAQGPESASPSPEAGALLSQRMAEWNAEKEALDRARHGDVTPEVRAMAERFVEWFIVKPQSLEHAAPLGLGALSVLEQYAVLQGQSPGENTEMRQALPEGFEPPSLLFCFGACYTPSHEVAALQVVVELDHDDTGAPLRWRVLSPSGDLDFDRMAIESVKHTAMLLQGAVPASDKVAQLSRWAFRAGALRFTRTELLLDPVFEPPGMPLDEHSGVLGKTTMAREVRLLAIVYKKNTRTP